MSFAALQVHGRWRSERSLHRYETHGRLLKLLNQTGDALQAEARALVQIVANNVLATLTQKLVVGRGVSAQENLSRRQFPGADTVVCEYG